MKRLFCVAFVLLAAFVLAPQLSLNLCREAFAVQPPSQDVRVKAERGHEKKKMEKGKEIKKSGCPYGKDKKTGKCYKPREGQFYEDSKGNVHVKETKCINLPWRPCGGSTPAVVKEKKKEKKEKKKGAAPVAAKKPAVSKTKTETSKTETSKPADPPQTQSTPSGARGAGVEALR